MATEERNKKQGFIFNSTSGLLQFVLTTVLIFLSIPVFLRNLGDMQYGIFCTVSVIGNLTVFANLSLDAALIKFLAEQGKCKESNYDIYVMLFLLLTILIPFSLLLYLFREFILISILNIPLEYLAASSKLLGFLILSNAILLIGKVFTSMLDSLQKIYLSNFAMFLYSTIYWGGVILVVLNGYGLPQVGFVIFLASFIWLLLVLGLALKEWGRFSPKGISTEFRRIINKQLGYSIKIYVGGLLGFMHEPLTKILISNLIGLPAVGIYEIALKIKNQLVSIFMKLLYPLFPLLAQMHDHEKLRRMVNKSTEGLSYIIIPILVAVAFCTRPFMELWIGGDNVDLISVSTIILAAITLLLSIPVTPIYFYIRAKNHPGNEIYIQGINVVINTLIIVLLYQKLGFYAVLLGNTLAFVGSFILCVHYQHKYLNIVPSSFVSAIKRGGKFLLCFAFTAAIGYLVSLLFEQSGVKYILLEGSAIVLASILSFYIFKVFKKEDLNLIR